MIGTGDRPTQIATSGSAPAEAELLGALEQAGIGVVILTPSLRVSSFTSAARAILGMDNDAIGCPFAEFGQRIGFDGLATELERVATAATGIEREFAGPAGLLTIRMLPRLPPEDGIVVTLTTKARAGDERARSDGEERFRMMAAAVPAFLFIAAADLTWQYVNPPFYAYTGMTEDQATGKGWLRSIHPNDLQPCQDIWGRAVQTRAALETEARLRRDDGAWRWFLIRAVPQLDTRGDVLRLFGSCIDIDERRQVASRQSVLLAEQQHRVKNILAVVRSVLNRTLESSTDLEAFASHLAGRIGALARTQTVAARTAERLVMLDELVHDELASHGGQDERQISVEGPPVALSDRVASPLGLTMHELATNALKFGALSVASGRVNVRWSVNSKPSGLGFEEIVAIEWRESGVPLTDLRPTRRGFGRELIEQGLPYELSATTSLEFRAGGLRCLIEFPLHRPG